MIDISKLLMIYSIGSVISIINLKLLFHYNRSVIFKYYYCVPTSNIQSYSSMYRYCISNAPSLSFVN